MLPRVFSSRAAHCVFSLTLIGASLLSAQGRGADQSVAGRATWDVTLARGKTRDIDFTTSEGTWMSADLSPDRTWVAFDLLGHIYRIPAAGGEATSLTQGSGVALNFQPRISPDGKTIAFITDRKGQYNLWVMSADGSNQRAVFSDLNATALEPAWTPDGNFIPVRKGGRAGGEGGAPSGGIWMYHKDGGAGVEIVGAGSGRGGAAGGGGGAGANSAPQWPSVSGDGRYLFYQVSMPVADKEPLSGSLQRRRGWSLLERWRRGAGDFAGRTMARLRAPDSRWVDRVQGSHVRPANGPLVARHEDWRRTNAHGSDRADVGQRLEDPRRAAALSLGE